jgi:hypothetical protein
MIPSVAVGCKRLLGGVNVDDFTSTLLLLQAACSARCSECLRADRLQGCQQW